MATREARLSFLRSSVQLVGIGSLLVDAASHIQEAHTYPDRVCCHCAGFPMLPLSWQEMQCPQTKVMEKRKVAKVL